MGTRYCPQDGGHDVKVAFRPKSGERYCPKHGCPTLDADPSAAKKSSSLMRKESPAEAQARQRFNRIVCAERCFFSDEIDGAPRRPDHECVFPLDGHHLVEKQWMRRELVLPKDELIAVIFNPLLGAPLCRAGHTPVEARAQFIYWDELRSACIEFCEDVDRRQRLILPSAPSMLARLRLESPVRDTQPERTAHA
jgi:hypothetical protein